MFSGIIESIGIVSDISEEKGNRVFFITSNIGGELKPDQSLAHNGVCLTVESVKKETNTHRVTAIAETLDKSMLGYLKKGDRVNLERSLGVNGRVDGHFVQGHVDTCGIVREILDAGGSQEYFIEYSESFESLVVMKGSICVNGISLTIAKSTPENHLLSVCIIPYTREHTNISDWKIGDRVNLEFDILGKYVLKFLSLRS